MDVRYNVINWVHRSTRGWSYGSSVSDPRTGEIIKGHVLLGSLRVRQDFLIPQGLIRAYEKGKTPDPRLEQMALARLRQLSAHEVGHTLGAIIYGYQDFPDGKDKAAELKNILQQTIAMGLKFISDEGARPAGGGHPHAHLWDNGPSPMEELERMMKARKKALEDFGEENIPEGAPLATLEDVLAPLYFAHRYQVEAVAKLIGGVGYAYAVRADGQETVAEAVFPELQLQAMKALQQTLKPGALALPPACSMPYRRSR